MVLIGGAYPIAMFDEAGKAKVRAQFRRLGWIMRIPAALGRSARMSPAETADVVIEMDAVNGELAPDFAALECPTEFVVGSGAHSGAIGAGMRTMRDAAAEARRATRACPCSPRRPTTTCRSSARPLTLSSRSRMSSTSPPGPRSTTWHAPPRLDTPCGRRTNRLRETVVPRTTSVMTNASYERDPRVDQYIDALPDWEQAICRHVRELVHAADPEVEETIKRRVQPYFVLQGNICALLATKDHVNVFLYDGGIVPDPEGIITGGHDNKTARTVAIYEGETLNDTALRTMFEQIIANNRAGGWRKLKRES